MKREEKAKVMNRTDSQLNMAKNGMFAAVGILEEHGMTADAEKLMNMIYKLEALQNKYNY